MLADLQAWGRYACLPEVTCFTSSTAQTWHDLEPLIRSSMGGKPDSPVRFAVEAEASGALVATVGFHSISPAFGTAEISFDVAPSHWGRGIATAVCRAASGWAFEARGWHRIQAAVLPANVASQKVVERVGYQREGLARRFRTVRGVPTDYWIYALVASDGIGTP